MLQDQWWERAFNKVAKGITVDHDDDEGEAKVGKKERTRRAEEEEKRQEKKKMYSQFVSVRM